MFDLRQRQLMQTFIAHDSDVKSIAVDDGEEFFVTGSLDGDIKVRYVFKSVYFIHIMAEIVQKNWREHQTEAS